MDPLFTEEQLNKMSREDIISLMKTMREHYQKQETKIQILEEKTKEFARYDLNLSTKTMANWSIQCADRYLQPLYELMKEEFLRSRYAHGDETRVQVIDEPEQKGSTQNYGPCEAQI